MLFIATFEGSGVINVTVQVDFISKSTETADVQITTFLGQDLERLFFFVSLINQDSYFFLVFLIFYVCNKRIKSEK